MANTQAVQTITIGDILGQVLHIIYCNCTVTLIHSSVPCEDIPGAVDEADLTHGRCPQCLALVRMAHVHGVLALGPTVAYSVISRTAEAIHRGEDQAP
jgi:hypothetical protein